MADHKDDEQKNAARALGAKGGKARAEKMSPERRAEIAAKANAARWANSKSGIPRETHAGVVKIGEREIPCSVLDTGMRVFSTRGLIRLMGSKTQALTAKEVDDGAPRIPPFLASPRVFPFVSPDLLAHLERPISYRPKHGGKPAVGHEATLLPLVCEAVLDARKAASQSRGRVPEHLERMADIAEVLLRGFARVGIIALIDEATGYQYERAKDELSKILQAYIAEELRPYVSMFPNEFFRQIYRLHGWEFREGNAKRPGYVGKLINKLVYEKLPPPVLPELQARNPVINGHRKHKHFQLLTEETGVPHLDKQIAQVTVLMRASKDKAMFAELFAAAYPTPGQQMPLKLEPRDEDDDEGRGR